MMINIFINIISIIFILLILKLIYNYILELFPWLITDFEDLCANKYNYLIFIHNFSYPKLINGLNSTYKNILSMILYDINDNFMPDEDEDNDLLFEITFYIINPNMEVIPLNKSINYHCDPYLTSIEVSKYFNNIEWLDSKEKYLKPSLILVKLNVLKPI